MLMRITITDVHNISIFFCVLEITHVFEQNEVSSQSYTRVTVDFDLLLSSVGTTFQRTLNPSE